MKFMITFNHIDGAWDRLTPEQQAEHGRALREFMRVLEKEKGSHLVFLHPWQSARTVRLHADGRLEVSDGPRTAVGGADPGSEHPGGYYIIEADTVDEAVEWAKKGRFMVGSNEIRQIADFRG